MWNLDWHLFGGKKSRWANGTLNLHSESIQHLYLFFSWLNNVWFPYYRFSSPWRFVYASLRVQMTTLRSKISSDQRKFKLNFRLSASPKMFRRSLFFVLLQSSKQRNQEVIMRWVVSRGTTNRLTVVFSAYISCIDYRNERHLYRI